ncbi:CrcB family protein [Lactiplantibacillus pentosus]|uniref:Fluoride-specific ion channel FluC n=1 Tax=Lactiplantibacillus pentosus TaxID=1589 RepID=A0AB37RHM5_LACPE|nr:CrcB family protein [Lactiplantibacillus pentosus]RMW42625.1 chromosome condensation protein CrcB [Lactiplantibacillus pentosus]RMW48203.1 chromosome condensation protein CrcB [Lactiplantibacillus pentosus]RMW52342.1 chromosome condensation protein CrcB [Lactiplantibacillus pentosus]RMW55076.1 chromosome condensation protein CrcB [Lactiplantibacillus pentosus]
MKKIIAIAAFAILGGGLREVLSLLVTWPQHFWITCLINIVGAFVLSLITTLLPARLPVSEAIITGMSVGLIGSFTTFSTFTFETLQSYQSGHSVLALLSIVVSIGLGLLAGLAGNLLSEHWLPEGEA